MVPDSPAVQSLPLDAAPASAAWVTFVRDNKPVRVDLDRTKMVFGRSSNCDVLLPLKGVSRAHYMIENEGTLWIVSDLNSTNGTYVNDAAVTRHPLQDGDQITLGPPGLVPLTIMFHRADAGPERPPSAALDEDEGHLPRIHASIGMEQFLRSNQPDAADEGRAEPDAFWALQIVTRMGQLLLSDCEIDGLLRAVLDLAFEHLPVERGSIWLTDESAGTVTARATRNTADPGGSQIAISRSIVNAAIKSRQSILLAEAEQDPRFAGATSIHRMHIKSAMCAPLYYEDSIRGFIYVDVVSDWMSLNEKHLELLTALAIFAAVGIRLREKTPVRPESTPTPDAEAN